MLVSEGKAQNIRFSNPSSLTLLGVLRTKGTFFLGYRTVPQIYDAEKVTITNIYMAKDAKLWCPTRV